MTRPHIEDEVVTGKGYGTTNLIALDPRGTVLAEHTLKITAPKDGTGKISV